MKQLKQLSGKYTNSYMLIQLLRSEPLENGKRLLYNFKFTQMTTDRKLDIFVTKASISLP